MRFFNKFSASYVTIYNVSDSDDKSSGCVRCVQFLHWFFMTISIEVPDNKSNKRRFFMTMFMQVLDNKSDKRREVRFGCDAQGL